LPPSEYPIEDVPLDDPIFRMLLEVKKIPQVTSIRFWRATGGRTTSERGAESAVPHLRAGRLRGIGVTALRRASALPEVPTLDELGLTGFELTQWQAVVAPAGTPKPVVDLLYREVALALKMPDVVERLATQGGNQLVGNTPEEFAQVIKDDLAKYAKLIKAAKIQVQ